MADAAARAAARGVRSMVGFTYRRVPAVTFLRDLIAEGRSAGCSRCVRATGRTGSSTRRCRSPGACRRSTPAPARSATSARTPSTWRSSSPARRSIGLGRDRDDREGAPAARLGLGPLGHRREGYGEVTVDDVAIFTGRFDDGALGSFEATRFATGRKNALTIEVSGDKGALAFDLEDLNALQFYDRTGADDRAGLHQDPGHRGGASVRRGLVARRPHARLRARLQPPGEGPREADRRRAPTRTRRSPTGLQVQRVLDAVERRAEHDPPGSASPRAPGIRLKPACKEESE